MALIYLDIKYKGQRSKHRLNNEACFTALNRGVSGIESITYWAYPLTTNYSFGPKVDNYLDAMHELFPFFPETNLANIMRRGFTIRDTDQYPGMYANFLLRLVRPIQEKPRAIDAFCNWKYQVSSYHLPNKLKAESNLRDYLLNDNKNKLMLAFLLSQEVDVENFNLTCSNLPATKVHDVFDNGLRWGCLEQLLTVGERLDNHTSLFTSGTYWSEDGFSLGPEKFVLGSGREVSIEEYAVREDVEWDIVGFIRALTSYQDEIAEIDSEE